MYLNILLVNLAIKISHACVPGFRYVPPNNAEATTTTTNDRNGCIPCTREEQNVHLGSSSRNWGGLFTTPTTTTTETPCCTTTGQKLTNATGCGQATTRIVGGQDATENQFPWQCMIQKSDGSFYGCGATIISCDPVIIISAAHCFQGANASPGGKKVACGAWKLDATDTNEQSLTITEIINHPQYVDATSANDIAILKVSGTFTCATDKIYPACLPSTNKYTYEGWADTIVSGWGTTEFQGSISNTLQYVKVTPVSDATCNEPASYNGQIISDQMICAGFAAGGKDACQGDSGGPLVTKATGVDAGYALAGVVSFGEGCAGPNKYGVYAEFSNYLSWVAGNFGLEI